MGDAVITLSLTIQSQLAAGGVDRRGVDEPNRRPASVKASLSVAFSQRAPNRSCDEALFASHKHICLDRTSVKMAESVIVSIKSSRTTSERSVKEESGDQSLLQTGQISDATDEAGM